MMILFPPKTMSGLKRIIKMAWESDADENSEPEVWISPHLIYSGLPDLDPAIYKIKII